ncbi:hypothetical protein EJ07DRAFT_176051 [Lizonia empirigonia]|nr:hypothetical protein EJ07DRAFT_176051 [Lizonia empirigonia]
MLHHRPFRIEDWEDRAHAADERVAAAEQKAADAMRHAQKAVVDADLRAVVAEQKEQEAAESLTRITAICERKKALLATLQQQIARQTPAATKGEKSNGPAQAKPSLEKVEKRQKRNLSFDEDSEEEQEAGPREKMKESAGRTKKVVEEVVIKSWPEKRKRIASENVEKAQKEAWEYEYACDQIYKASEWDPEQALREFEDSCQMGPAPKAPDINSVRPAEPVMFIPPVAEPVADVILIPLIPLVPLIRLIPLISLDMVIEVLMDMPLMPEVIEEPLVATTAAAAASLSHIIVTT